MTVGEVLVRLALDPKQYEKDLNTMEGVTRRKALTLGSILKGAFSFALGIGLLQGFRSLTGAVTDFVNTAARTEMLDAALRAVARSSGYSLAILREQQGVMQDLGIAEQEATQILTRFMQAQLDVTQAAKLARVAQDAAVIAGYNSSEAAEQMTEAIAKQQPRLLAQFGMMAGLEEIYDQYAKTVGKNVNELTRMEKKQAMLNYILAEGERIAGTYETAMGSAGKKIGSLKRYWDTLKNAIAKPLALPALNVIVDGITNALKNAIIWAQANELTLRAWGQTAVNVVSLAGRGFAWVTGVIKRHWQAIRFAAVTLLTYAAAARVAAGAGSLLAVASQILNGQLTAKAGVLGLVSTAMGIYRVQMYLAAKQGLVLTGALAKLRVALYAVQAAAGPVGWLLLGLSLIVSGGIALWNKYNQTLQKTPSLSLNVEDATAGVTKGFEDQAEAMKKAGKAANKNLQAFDEVHQLQEDVAGSGEDVLDALDFGAMGAGIPALDFEDMLAGFEETAIPFGERVKGFFGWLWDGIKTGAVAAWNWITGTLKTIWDGFVNLTRPVWEPLAKFFSGLWEGIKSAAKTLWNAIVFMLAFIWFSIVEIVKTIFGPLMPFFARLWDGIKLAASTAWNWLRGFLSAVWNSIVSTARTIWGFLGPLVTGVWESIRNTAVAVWQFLLPYLTGVWNTISGIATTVWNAIKNAVANPVEAARQAVETISNRLKTGLQETWEAIRSTAASKWDAVRNVIKSAINGIISIINRFIKAFNKIEIKVPSVNIPLLGEVGGWSVRVPQIPEIPMLAKGGLVTSPTLAMLGEAGPEAVIPLGRGGMTDDLAASIYEAAYNAIRDGLRAIWAEQSASGDRRDIVLKINNTELAREQLSALIWEGQRQGLDIIVRPRGA